MKFKQILLILLVFALTSVKAQNCLDDVHLNLPQDINWEVQKVHFENDSLRRQQEWLVKDEKGAFKMNFVIFSVDKSEPNMSLAEVKEGLLKRPREKHEVTRLGESELKGDYSLETYKVIAAHKVRNSRGSFLMAFTETDKNVHIIYIRSAALKLSEDFISQWRAAFKKLMITPAKI